MCADILIAGCGDIGIRVAKIEQADGKVVAALARSNNSALSLTNLNISAIRADLDIPSTLSAVAPPQSILYYFAPPPSTGTEDPRLKALLQSLDEKPGESHFRIVYISTSGVYGDCQGQWVTEERPVAPKTDRARRRVAAELALQTWAKQTRHDHVILRVPGIYGPNRWPLERIREGKPVVRRDEAPFSNRIHADDLARICVAAARIGQSGAIYNVSDGQPSTMTDYFFQIADACALPRPPEISMDQARQQLGASLLSFLGESKRLDNGKMLKDLQVRLRFPDLASGLADSVLKKLT